MADPLSVLRDFCSGGRVNEVELRPDGRVYFADQYSFAKSTPTAFKVNGGGLYELEAVVSFIRAFAADADFRARLKDYLDGCKQHTMRPVVVADRKVRWAGGRDIARRI